MKGIFLLALTLSIGTTSFAEGWMLKSPMKEKQHSAWRVTVSADINGSQHQAQFTQSIDIDQKTDKGFKGSTSWADVQMDGSDLNQELPKWNVAYASNGSIVSANDGADYARMLAPEAFVYPDKEVSVGDKWTAKFKPADAKEFTVDYAVLAQEKVGDVDALKISGKLKEDGPMTGTETFWIGKDGAILKFDIDVQKWTVPFAGDPSEFDAKIHGEWLKPKN